MVTPLPAVRYPLADTRLATLLTVDSLMAEPLAAELLMDDSQAEPLAAEPLETWPIAPPLATPQPAESTWVEVLVDCPGAQGLYTYSIPADQTVQLGDILSVPFGSQQIGAIALRFLSNLPPTLSTEQIRPISEIVSSGFFSPNYWQLLEQVADYYCTPLMQVLKTALPPGLLGRSQRRIRLRSDLPNGASEFLSVRGRGILAKLQQSKTQDYTWRYLQQTVKGAPQGIRELLKKGWAESYLEPPTASQPKLQQMVTLVPAPTAIADLPEGLTAKQTAVLALLKKHGGESWLTDLTAWAKVSTGVIKTLEKKGYVALQQREVLRSESLDLPEPDDPKPLTPDQTQALQIIQQTTGFQPILLHGVTGSGKTEVYLQAIAPILARQQSALVLVPEIGLTPQLTDRFRRRFGHRVCVYHSALSDGERYDTWRQLLGTPGSPAPAQVVIGTRSAIFAPLSNLGLIILDEEHDSSFKQDQPMPCYHARTVALWRGQSVGCPVILGSATPSVETWVAYASTPELLQGGVWETRATGLPHSSLDSPNPDAPPAGLYLSLPNRVQARPMPPVEIVDMRLELQEGNRSMFSRRLQQALHNLKAKNQQGILFVPRRGHSTFVSCRSCGAAIDCPHCDVSLTYHLPHANAQPLLRCHYCNTVQVYPDRCPSCGSPYLKHFGSGTQRVTQELSQLFPELRWIRFDSDTTRNKGSHRTLLSRFAQGEADLLVGTQMLTKGLDLPQVTLVGILAADGLLHLSDFRAGERAAQTLLQVSGRAGRGEEPGQVLLQTYTPEHPVIQAVQRHAYDTFLASEIAARSALNYPPIGRLILLRLSSADATAVEQAAKQIAQKISQALNTQAIPNYEILGPSPALIPRVAQRYRWQVLLKLNSIHTPPTTIDHTQITGEWLRSHCPPNVSLIIDVDPLNVS